MMKDKLYIFGAVLFMVASYFVFTEVFTFFNNKSLLVPEIFAAILGSVVTVASMSVMMKFQSNTDKEKEFSAMLFQKKLEIYQRVLTLIFEADDDNIISKKEIQEIENHMGCAYLLAKQGTVEVFSQFLYQLKTYGVLYVRSMEAEQRAHFANLVTNEVSKQGPSKKSFLTDKNYQKVNDLIKNKADLKKQVNDYFVGLDELLEAMRQGLDVVEGEINHESEHFTTIAYDHQRMIRNPNNVD